jgi:hypothetical protein
MEGIHWQARSDKNKVKQRSALYSLLANAEL